MSTHLFLFTIGPVQSFIAQARKTSDLYAGSRILSELINAAIQTFEQNGGTVIFPYPHNEAKPNRFLGKIEKNNSDTSELKNLGQNIEKTVRDTFKKMAEKALKHAKAQKPKGFDEQIEHHLDIFWVFQNVEGDYLTAYQEIEKNMGAIKNIRAFHQLAERGRKCSVDGERNALFYKKNENGTQPAFLNRDAIQITGIDEVTFAKGETLSAISLTKRFYYEDISFPSTAQIAILNILPELEESNEFKYYKNIFGKKWDERFLYQENLTEKELNTMYNKAQNAHAFLSKFISKHNLKLHKYYAVLVFDGDNMGKILSGQLLANKQHLEEYQKFLSQLLGDYAKWATDYVNRQSRGRTIYAGGDDFMGFLNLEYLFDTLKTLRTEFEISVNQKLKSKYSLILNNQPFDFTFSAGITIAHYKTPLGIVLKTAKKMEDKAKDSGRNAFGIAVIKHSGEQHEMTMPWGIEAQNLGLIQHIVDKHQTDFSDTWIKNINNEFLLLQDDDYKIGNQDRDIRDMFNYELKRLLQRSRMNSNKEKVDELYKVIEEVLYAIKYDFQKFIHALNICQFIVRKTK